MGPNHSGSPARVGGFEVLATGLLLLMLLAALLP